MENCVDVLSGVFLTGTPVFTFLHLYVQLEPVEVTTGNSPILSINFTSPVKRCTAFFRKFLQKLKVLKISFRKKTFYSHADMYRIIYDTEVCDFFLGQEYSRKYSTIREPTYLLFKNTKSV